MTPTHTLIRHLLAAGAAALMAGGAVAQPAALPEGVLRIIVPTTPGSTPDLLARNIAPKISTRPVCAQPG